MREKKSENNPICGKRLKELLKIHGMKSKDLAEKLHYSPQHISYMITGKRAMTNEFIDSVIALFPSTRKEWLIGEDDSRNMASLRESQFANSIHIKQLRRAALNALLKSFGFCFEPSIISIDFYLPLDDFVDNKKGEVTNVDDSSILFSDKEREDIVEKIFSNATEENIKKLEKFCKDNNTTKYNLKSVSTNAIIATFTAREVDDMAEDITEITEKIINIHIGRAMNNEN